MLVGLLLLRRRKEAVRRRICRYRESTRLRRYVYIRRLANVDLKVLEKLVARSVAETKSRYPQPNENDP
jgi:hypothetical protein